MRSIVSIVAGFLVATALAFGAEMLLLKIAPALADPAARAQDIAALVVMLAYAAIALIAGAYVTARLAPRRPMMHAVILGVIALALALTESTVFWNVLPAWSHVASIVLVLPAAWFGGLLYARPGQRRVVVRRNR